LQSGLGHVSVTIRCASAATIALNLFDQTEGWPGLRDAAAAKDFIAKYQITAESWYCAYPDATVRDIWRSQKIAKALDGLLDASQP
jgi:hypothetical protein